MSWKFFFSVQLMSRIFWWAYIHESSSSTFITMQIIFSLMPFLILANFAPAFLSVILEDFVSDILDLASHFPGLVRSPPWPSLDLTAAVEFSGCQLIVCAFVLFLGRPCLQYPRPCLSFPWPSFPWPCTGSSLAFDWSHRSCGILRTSTPSLCFRSLLR